MAPPRDPTRSAAVPAYGLRWPWETMAQTPKTEAMTTSSLSVLSNSTVGSATTLVSLRVAISGLCPVVPHDYPKYHTVSARKVAQTYVWFHHLNKSSDHRIDAPSPL